jgi:sporulation protein YlmC with PRC-barrel domain
MLPRESWNLIIMRPSQLEDKKVVETGARIIGSVSGVEIDVSAWKVTHLRIELTNEMVDMLGYKKTLLWTRGHLGVC